MFVIAVTGGIGAGKTTAADYFASRGAEVLDADTIAKSLLKRGAPAYGPVVERFGTDVLGEDGEIERPKLAAAAFAAPESARALDAIVHPLVGREVERQLDAYAARAVPPAVVVLDVPLLAEAPGLAALLDFVLLLTAPEDVRVARAVGRGMEERDVKARLARQLPDEDRRRGADEEIVNAGDQTEFRRLLSEFWEREVEPRVS